MQYRLGTLLIVLGIAPPLLAAAWWAYPHVANWIVTGGAGNLVHVVFGSAYIALAVLVCAFVASRFAAAITRR
jgi:hypothetical protein